MSYPERPVTDVIILGAGASKAAGCPLLNDFMDRVEAIYWENKSAVWKPSKDFELVLQLIRHLRPIYMTTGLNVLNIEELYGLVETDQLIGVLSRVQTKGGEKFFANIKQSLDVVITETIQRSSFFEFRKGGTNNAPRATAVIAHQSYRDFAAGIKRGLSQGRRYAILTFNYDLEVEVALEELEITYSYDLDGSLSGGSMVSLLKLHGSLNWFPVKDGELHVVDVSTVIEGEVKAHNKRQVEANSNPRITLECAKYIDASYTTNRALDELDSPHGGASRANSPLAPVIVPPLLNKGALQASVSGVWKAAALALSKAKHIHITGYSYPPSDNFFRYLFGLGMMSSDTFISGLHVYDPGKATRDRFEAMLGRGLDGRFHAHEVYFHDPDSSNSAVGRIFPQA